MREKGYLVTCEGSCVFRTYKKKEALEFIRLANNSLYVLECHALYRGAAFDVLYSKTFDEIVKSLTNK